MISLCLIISLKSIYCPYERYTFVNSVPYLCEAENAGYNNCLTSTMPISHNTPCTHNISTHNILYVPAKSPVCTIESMHNSSILEMSNLEDSSLVLSDSLLTHGNIHIFSDTPNSDPHLNFENNKENENKKLNPYNILKGVRVANINRLIIGQLNINSLRNKFEALKETIKGNLDILIITETKLDDSFPINQFIINGYSPPFRADRNKNGGGIIIYVRDDIPCRELNDHPSKKCGRDIS